MARVLIIEDDPDIADLYRLTLVGRGHEIVGVLADPRAARSDWPDPDVIILDERLGQLSGTAFLPSLRAAFPLARILFASADPAAERAARQGGADEVRHKPFTLEELASDVDALIAQPRDGGVARER